MADEEKTVPIDDYLKKKVLARLGLEDGDVQVNKETWDLGILVSATPAPGPKRASLCM